MLHNSSISGTEQLRKLGKLLSYYLDKFNQKGVFICHRLKMRSSVAVGTAEQGCAPSRSALCPGNRSTTALQSQACDVVHCMHY
jgi:hypothetical protein